MTCAMEAQSILVRYEPSAHKRPKPECMRTTRLRRQAMSKGTPDFARLGAETGVYFRLRVRDSS
jgi:hypothetical protein